MTAEIESINSRSADEDVVAVLEELLEAAKAGELVALIGVDVYRDGGMGSIWLGNEGVTDETAAHLEALKADIQFNIRLNQVMGEEG